MSIDYLITVTLLILIDTSITLPLETTSNNVTNITKPKKPCSQYKDCFNCSMNTIDNYSCEWDSNDEICYSYSKGKRPSLGLQELYLKCSDKHSQDIMKMYCTDIMIKQLYETYEIVSYYAPKNLLCVYESNNMFSDYLFQINITKSLSSISVGFLYFYSFYKRYESIKATNSYNIQISGLKSVKVFLFFSETIVSNGTETIIISLSFIKPFLSSISRIAIDVLIFFGIFLVFIFIYFFILASCNLMKNKQKTKQVMISSSISQFSNEIGDKSVLYSTITKKCNSQCSICLEEFDPKSNVHMFNCNHIFHSKCIKEFIVQKKMKKIEFKCPLCHLKPFDDNNILKEIESIQLNV